MDVTMLNTEASKALTMQVLKGRSTALAYIDVLRDPAVEKDINDLIVLETLLLNEQNRMDCSAEEYKKIIGLLIMYWKMKGESVSGFLPDIVKEAKEEAESDWEENPYAYVDKFKDVNELSASILQEKMAYGEIPEFYFPPSTNFDNLFDVI